MNNARSHIQVKLISIMPERPLKRRLSSSPVPDIDPKKRRSSPPLADIEEPLSPPMEVPAPEPPRCPPPKPATEAQQGIKAIFAKLVQAAGDPNEVASGGFVSPSMDVWPATAYVDVVAGLTSSAVSPEAKHMVIAGLIAAAHDSLD